MEENKKRIMVKADSRREVLTIIHLFIYQIVKKGSKNLTGGLLVGFPPEVTKFRVWQDETAKLAQAN